MKRRGVQTLIGTLRYFGGVKLTHNPAGLLRLIGELKEEEGLADPSMNVDADAIASQRRE